MAESLTQKEVANRLGISPSTVRKHSNDGRIPRNDDGSYPWPAARDAYLGLKEEAAVARASGFGDDSYEAARARKTAAQARLAELEVLQKEGALVALDDLEAMLRDPLEKVNTALKGVPSRYGARLAKAAGVPLAQAKALLSDVIEAVRTELREIPEDDSAA